MTKHNTHHKPLVLLSGLVALLFLTVWITPHIGAVELTPEQLSSVISEIRRPKLYLGMLAGAGLSLAGMTFQALFRNPLASPFTLGVSSGASLAIAVGLISGLHHTWIGGWGQYVLSFSGAMGVVLLVYAVAVIRKDASSSTLLLAGVCINFICGAGIIMTQYVLEQYEATQVIHWLIGSIEAASPETRSATRMMAWLIFGGALSLLAIHRELDLTMMGDDIAASRGVSLQRIRWFAYLVASVMTAAVVSLCGPIAFVGLLVPNTMRTLIGPSHRWLLPACLLLGMSFLPLCDSIAYNLLPWLTPDNAQPLPVGVMTNILGGLFFLYVLIRQRVDRPIVA